MKRFFKFILKLTAVLSGIVVIVLAGVWIYFALRTGSPAPETPIFRKSSGGPLVFAHRGGGGVFPENTIGAFRISAELESDVLELDVHATRDGTLVVFHDGGVERTTNGNGRISELSIDEVGKLDAGYRFSTDGGATFPFRGKGVKVPTLVEILDTFPDRSFNIEPKQDNPQLISSLCQTIRERNLSSRVIVGSFRAGAVEEFRRICPEVPTAATPGEALSFFALYKTGLAKSARPAFKALQIPRRLGVLDVVNRDFVDAAHALNIEVHVWTINDEKDMRELIDAGVDGIMTDFPARAIELIRKK